MSTTDVNAVLATLTLEEKVGSAIGCSRTNGC